VLEDIEIEGLHSGMVLKIGVRYEFQEQAPASRCI